MKFCCSGLEFEVWKQNAPRQNKLFPNAIGYDCVERLFGCYITRGETFFDSDTLIIEFCPLCGAKLPTSLSDEYHRELEKVLGKEGYKALFYYKDEGAFKECPVLDRAKVPEEFKTDEWWIKRGL